MDWKRDKGLPLVLMPFDIGALIAAVLCTWRCGVRGLAVIPVFAGWWLCGFIGLMLVFYIAVYLLSLTVDMKKPVPTEDHPFFRAVVLISISHLCRFARLRLYVAGLEKLPKGRFLIVSNHRSAYDPITMVWALRKTPTAIITKPENHRIPMVGAMIYQANFLSIDREDPREAMKTISAAAQLLKNDVVSVGVYPEGTRNRTPEEGLLPFHNGVFKIAQKAEVPLVVAAVTGTEKIRKNMPWRHTDVYICLCGTIPPEELKGSTGVVSRRVQKIIEDGLRMQEN